MTYLSLIVLILFSTLLFPLVASLEVKQIKASLSKGGKAAEKELLVQGDSLIKNWVIGGNDSLIIEATLEREALMDSVQQVSLSLKGPNNAAVLYPVISTPLGKGGKADAAKFTFVLSQKEITAVRAEIYDDKYDLVLIGGGHVGKSSDSIVTIAALKKPLGQASFAFGESSSKMFGADGSFPFGETLSPLPEIHHVFRAPEKRPPVVVSQAFAAAVIAIPWLYLIVTWFRLGANIYNFPFSSISSVLFLVVLIGILAVLALAWYELKIFETLYYLFILSVGAVICGKGALNYLAKHFKL